MRTFLHEIKKLSVREIERAIESGISHLVVGKVNDIARKASDEANVKCKVVVGRIEFCDDQGVEAKVTIESLTLVLETSE
ncbi:MAG: hypothetical protein IH899_18435 [Planctomycetes bacterium]|nr:hypothetical protein [Planctomycetota bacterium]